MKNIYRIRLASIFLAYFINSLLCARDQVFLDGIMEIDAQFVKARDEVYAESFKTLSEMLMKIDSERASAIRSLHEKLYAAQADS
jgi:hypothetical protein